MIINDLYDINKKRTTCSIYNNKIVAISEITEEQIDKNQIYHNECFIYEIDNQGIDFSNIYGINSQIYCYNIHPYSNYMFFNSHLKYNNVLEIVFYRKDINSTNIEKIGSYKFDSNHYMYQYGLYGGEIKSLGDNYSLYLFTNEINDIGVLLIDANKKRIIDISNSRPNIDLITHCCKMQFVENEIIIKTGRINYLEKQQYVQDVNFEEVNETLINIKKEQLIDGLIKQSNLSYNILEQCYNENSIELLFTYNKKNYYVLHDFKNNLKHIKSYNVDNMQTNSVLTYKEDYSSYKYFNGIIYGINRYLCDNMNRHDIIITNLFNKEHLNISFDVIISDVLYIDNKDIILQASDKKGNVEVIIYEIYSGVMQRYKDRKARYFQDKDLLLLC